MKLLNSFIKEIKDRYDLHLLNWWQLDVCPSFKILLFSKSAEWKDCFIGMLIDGKFHILGIGDTNFTNEVVKKLYINLRPPFPKDELIFKHPEYALIDIDEQNEIHKSLKDICESE